MIAEGVVLRAGRAGYAVQVEALVVHCTVKGNLTKDFEYTMGATGARRVLRARRHIARDTLAVGDRVRVDMGPKGHGVILEVLPRTTRFSRAGFRGHEHTVVCNLDLIAIVFACAHPNPDLWKLDRFLVAAEAEGLRPVIVANKADLAPPDSFVEYAGLDYETIVTSARTGIGIACLLDVLAGRISAFVGPSGVGKSSLLNALEPGLELRTADVGHVTHKGRHTTTSAQLIALRHGGWVADTPGLRQFDLLNLAPEEIADCFPEFRRVVERCRFDDCIHVAEPGCAIKAALDRDEISRRRYESYLALLA